jgi:putative PIN family toxin of toxin-antitoxin system
MIRVVLDTNVLLSSIGLNSGYRRIFDAVKRGEIALVPTTEIVHEYEEILAQRTSPIVAANVVNTFLFLQKTVQCIVYFRWNLITDPDDNKFADAAIAGNADFLVSNDVHFGVLRSVPFPRVQVISPEDFLSLL